MKRAQDRPRYFSFDRRMDMAYHYTIPYQNISPLSSPYGHLFTYSEMVFWNRSCCSTNTSIFVGGTVNLHSSSPPSSAYFTIQIYPPSIFLTISLSILLTSILEWTRFSIQLPLLFRIHLFIGTILLLLLQTTVQNTLPPVIPAVVVAVDFLQMLALLLGVEIIIPTTTTTIIIIPVAVVHQPREKTILLPLLAVVRFRRIGAIVAS